MLVDDEDHEDDYHQGYDDYDDKPKKKLYLALFCADDYDYNYLHDHDYNDYQIMMIIIIMMMMTNRKTFIWRSSVANAAK